MLRALERLLGNRFGLKPDEAGRAWALAVIFAGITGSYTLTKTVRDAFFLERLPATTLPYVFIGVGLVSAAVSVAFARGTRRRTNWESLAAVSLVGAVSLAGFAQLFRVGARWVPVAFYVWANVYGLLLVSQFWLFANAVSHPREARRTFGLIGAGGIFGGLLGGLIAAPMARVWTLPTILSLAALVQALVLLMVRVGTPQGVEETSAEETQAPAPLSQPYVRWLALASLCAVMVSGLFDYLFKVQIQRRYSTTAELASFLGLFYVGSNLAALGLQVLGTRWMIQRLGAAWSASLLPIGLGVAAGVAAIAPAFAPVTLGRLWDQVTRLSVGRAAGELFYFPLEPALRRKAKALIEAGLERVGDGFAGILILAITFSFGATLRSAAFVALAIVVAWVFAWTRIRRGYVQELGLNLRRMNLGHVQSRVSLQEATLLQEMERLVHSPYERIVLQGIDLLEENDPARLEEFLDELLLHPSARVRARALRLMRERGSARLQDVERWIQDPDDEVRVEALTTHAAMGGKDLLDALEAFLASADPRVRASAARALIENAPREGEGRVEELMRGRLAESEPEDRAVIAASLGRRPPPSALHDLLDPLLADADLGVRRAALRSAGAAQRRQHVPLLIDALGRRATEDDARAGLATLGDRVVGTLGDYLTDSSVPIEIRHAIPRALGEIHTQDSVHALFRSRERSDVRLSYRVLKASNHIRAARADLRFPTALVTEDVEHDAREHLFALVHYRSCPIGTGWSPERMLCVVLNERMEQALNRVFRRLALLYPPNNVLAAYQGIVSDEPRRRGNAIEYLENALSSEHRGLVLPLVDDSGEQTRLALAQSRFGLGVVSFDDAIESLLRSEDSWLQTCALYVVGSRKQKELLPLVEKRLATDNPLVRETATWARVALTAS